MFSNHFKSKIMKRYNISESILNRPIHYRIPDLVNFKLKPYPVYYSSKKLNNNIKEIEAQKTNSVPISRNQNNRSLKKEYFNKNLELILNDENLINMELNKRYNKSIKMIYEIKKYQNLSSKAVINDLINKKNHKKTTLFPKVFKNLQKSIKLDKINNMLPFFTPQVTKIKIKNRYKLRNLMDFPLKEKEYKDNYEKNIIQNEKSIECDKSPIKIINTNNNKFTIRKNVDIVDKNIKNNYTSYNDSPVRIRSIYYNTNSINDENEDEDK